MPFLVRKINKRDKLATLIASEFVEDIYADVPTNEFKTSEGTLSTWLIERFSQIAFFNISLISGSANLLIYISSSS